MSTTAALAAAVASIGDVLMLHVARERGSELGLLLVLGGVLGVVAIPLYALGYLAASKPLLPVSRSLAAVVAVAGGMTAALGAVIHGLTAAFLRADLAAGRPATDPLSAVLAWGPLLPRLWGVGILCAAIASLAFAWPVATGRSALARWLALLNPILVSIAVGAVGLGSELGRAYLTPAAPNLAHVVFFAVLRALPFRGRSPDGSATPPPRR